MNENIMRHGKVKLAEIQGPKYILKNLATGGPAWDALLDGTKCLLSFKTEAAAHKFVREIIPAIMKSQFQVAEMPLEDWLILLRRVQREGVKYVNFLTVAGDVEKESIEIASVLTSFAAADAAFEAHRDGTNN